MYSALGRADETLVIYGSGLNTAVHIALTAMLSKAGKNAANYRTGKK
jgi:hypothetical protein